MEQKRINPGVISIIVIVLIAAAAGTVYIVGRGGVESETVPTESSQTVSPATNESASIKNGGANDSSSEYTDGEYTAAGRYSTPGGTESVKVTLTLTRGSITKIETTGSATRGDSARYQAAFLSGYESLVVGKSIDEVSLSRVAGSSLTSGGFNRAIEAIQDEAVS